MGAWADGLAADSKKRAEIDEKNRKRAEKFKKKFLNYEIKEIITGDIGEHPITTQEMYFLCLRQILINQEAVLADTEGRYAALGDTRMLLKRLEKMMIGGS